MIYHLTVALGCLVLAGFEYLIGTPFIRQWIAPAMVVLAAVHIGLAVTS